MLGQEAFLGMAPAAGVGGSDGTDVRNLSFILLDAHPNVSLPFALLVSLLSQPLARGRSLVSDAM